MTQIKNQQNFIEQSSIRYQIQTITFYLRLWNGKGIKIQKSSNQKLSNIKQIIASQFQIPYQQIRTVFKGIQLSDQSLTLKQSGISQKSILHIMRTQNKQVINVQIIYAQKKLIKKIAIASSQKILKLKQTIERQSQIPIRNQVLIYCGGQLQNNQIVSTYKLNTGSSIFLVDKTSKNLQGRKEWFQGRQLSNGMKITSSINFNDPNNNNPPLDRKFISFKQVVSVVESQLVHSEGTDQIKQINQLQPEKKQGQMDRMTKSVRVPNNQILNKTNMMFKSSIQSINRVHDASDDIKQKHNYKVDQIEEISIYEDQNSCIQDKKNQYQQESDLNQVKQSIKDIKQIEKEDEQDLRIVLLKDNGIALSGIFNTRDNILQIKKKISLKNTLPLNIIRLKQNDIELNENQTIKELKWKNNEIIQIELL